MALGATKNRFIHKGADMKLQYVGNMPIVSKNGVGFDPLQPDRYLYLHAALELLEALSYGATEQTQHLYKTEHKDIKPNELLEGLKKYIKNLDEIYATREAKAEHLVDDLIKRVHENETLNGDEKRAWLNNIKIMKDYYLQYITNKIVYEAALDALADEIAVAKVKQVTVPMFRNYGIVLKDLQNVLANRKAPIDSQMEVESTADGIIGTIKFSHF